MGVKPRVILDTDIGNDVDDAIALTLAAQSPEIELSAVTTVYGEVDGFVLPDALDDGGIPGFLRCRW